jgi:hypothetical protein
MKMKTAREFYGLDPKKMRGEYSSMSVNDGDVVTLDVTVHHWALLGASAPITGTGNVSFLFWL